MSHPFRFHPQVRFRDDAGFYDDGTAPQSFYENAYVLKNPSLHAEDASDKTSAVVRCLDKLGWHRDVRSIVDVGCGSCGALAGVLDHVSGSSGAAVWGLGVDVSASILSRGVAHPRLVRLRASADHLPMDDGALSLATCMDIIEHVPDPVAVLREVRRVARRVVLKIPLERSWYTALRGGRRRLASLQERFGHIHHFHLDDVRGLLTASGLQICAEDFVIIPRRSLPLDVLQRFLLRCGWTDAFARLFGGFVIIAAARRDEIGS